MLKDMKLNEFIDKLSSNSPAPGGGSVAALCCSLASALGSMVFNLTLPKKMYDKYDECVKEKINKALSECESGKQEFLKLMNDDANSFMELMNAFKLPKSSEEEKKVRSIKVQEGYKKAIDVPMKVARKSFEMYDAVEIACMYGNKNAVSDGAVAAILLQAGIESAILNVKTNLSFIKDEKFKEETKREYNNLLCDGLKRKQKILKIVNDQI